jgi:beta-lactamase regulating signal transducer with metallopeptidase domain
MTAIYWMASVFFIIEPNFYALSSSESQSMNAALSDPDSPLSKVESRLFLMWIVFGFVVTAPYVIAIFSLRKKLDLLDDQELQLVVDTDSLNKSMRKDAGLILSKRRKGKR